MGKKRFLILISCHLWKLISTKIVKGDICNTYIQWRTRMCLCICVCVCVCVCVYEYTYIHTPPLNFPLPKKSPNLPSFLFSKVLLIRECYPVVWPFLIILHPIFHHQALSQNRTLPLPQNLIQGLPSVLHVLLFIKLSKLH